MQFSKRRLDGHSDDSNRNATFLYILLDRVFPITLLECEVKALRHAPRLPLCVYIAFSYKSSRQTQM